MTGKVIDSGANSFLILLLPLALITMVLFVAWPFIVAIFILSLGYKLWQKFRLLQISEEIDPYFNKLVEKNQGSLTVLDITSQTELSAKTARLYLDSKAEEYGAVKRLYEDKTIVYYFLTASSLGSILDDSDPEPETFEPEPSATETISTSSNASSSPTVTAVEPKTAKTSTPKVEPEKPKSTSTKTKSEKTKKTTAVVESKSATDDTPKEIPEESKNKLIFNQTELAKRLEVSTSTIAKRKLDRDFGLWCQSRDPEGLPWQYVEESKQFVSSQ